MDSEIFKTLAGILLTVLIAGIPTLAEWFKRRIKARNAAAVRPRRGVVHPLSQSPTPRPDHRQAMAHAAESEAARTAPLAAAPATPADTAPPSANDRIAALRKAVIAAEVLQRRF